MSDIYLKLVKKYGLSATQKKIIEIVGTGKTILEVGSSHGYLTKEFVENGCIVDIIEKNPEAARTAKTFARKAFIGSAEDEKLLQKIKGRYDYVIFADVLEHLVSPEIPLIFSKKILKKGCRIVISIPNIASWPARKELFFYGKFEYEQSGLFDRTHLRFYSLNSFVKFLKNENFKIESIIPTEIYLPFQRTLTTFPIIGKLFTKIYQNLASIFPNLAYFHYVVICKSR